MRVVSVVLLVIAGCASADDAPQVNTPGGKLRGHTLTSRSGREFKAFSGVPYAKPPLGELRFQPPQRLEKWEGVRDALKIGPWCLQILPAYATNGSRTVLGEEDCLYLNVYTHDIHGNASVLVRIHGGAFYMGNAETYKPTFLMDYDIVIVEVNYRLGLFGFLSFENAEMPGNQGLKDQALALKWVQENIASFGGNPSQVTIFGDSAGGVSVYHHVISPLSKGLFHQAISSSGSSYNPWAVSRRGHARSVAEQLMRTIGCPTTPQQAIPCVMQKDAREIISNYPRLLVYKNDPRIFFNPTLEDDRPGSFLVRQWEHSPVPFLIAMSSAEGLIESGILANDLKKFSEDFDSIAADYLLYSDLTSNPAEVTKKIRQFYFNDRMEITLNEFPNVTNMFTDAWFAKGIIDGANIHTGDVYVYYFDYITKGVTFGLNESLITGAVHCGDVLYVMEMNIPIKHEMTEEETELSKKMVKLFATFIQSGKVSLEGLGGDWKRWKADSNNYVHIDKNGFHAKKGLLEERYNFWKSLNLRNTFDT